MHCGHTPGTDVISWRESQASELVSDDLSALQSFRRCAEHANEPRLLARSLEMMVRVCRNGGGAVSPHLLDLAAVRCRCCTTHSLALLSLCSVAAFIRGR